MNIYLDEISALDELKIGGNMVNKQILKLFEHAGITTSIAKQKKEADKVRCSQFPAMIHPRKRQLRNNEMRRLLFLYFAILLQYLKSISQKIPRLLGYRKQTKNL